ncbi:hypothetical protein ACFO25_05305 [Paenactinomyces guangxiensis]|uniref:Uncharacterized protein n=1 Tax=Paenactinomyces guangxiensis TaxID=1490290 RepID=A0A7W1WQS4_9BACL|nr:hypothetical protein [Paenactinomyces guangxiensis]MBA4494348.1 hypothetical protein [Paenactinomyces guangxiensis]MBH8590843.1 hypothetical protein [Paenactinomyces guangxiensis]
MAVDICEEGGTGAYVDYMKSDKNEKAEKWLQKELSKYPNGTRLFFHIGTAKDKYHHR